MENGISKMDHRETGTKNRSKGVYPPAQKTMGLLVDASLRQMFSRLASSGPAKLNTEAIRRRRKCENKQVFCSGDVLLRQGFAEIPPKLQRGRIRPFLEKADRYPAKRGLFRGATALAVRLHVRRACASFFRLSVSHRFYLLFSIFYFLVFPIGTVQAQEWQKVKSEHFIVYYSDDKKFAKKVSRQSEIYYRKIASELGYQRYSEFWTWDNRVKIYIHPSRESFLKATNQPKWSEGVANYTKKEISSYALSEGFLDALLPHEITHLIFRDYVGFKGEVPLWLDEGVAQWMEPRKRELVKSVVARLADQGALLSLQRMMTEDIRESQDSEFVGAYYVQAVSLVSFLVTKYSAARFTNFCRQLRDGKSIEESLTFAYPTSIRSIKELEKKWKKYIKEE